MAAYGVAGGTCENCKKDTTFDAFTLFDHHCSLKCLRMALSRRRSTADVMGNDGGRIHHPRAYWGDCI